MNHSFYRVLSLAAVFWTTVSMSAYTPHETGSRTTASGETAREGYTCAANFAPIGSVIIYDGHRYYVQDRMHSKYNRHVDIFMESHKKALQFGRKEARVQVITPDDEHLKLPGRKHSSKHTKPKVKPWHKFADEKAYTQTSSLPHVPGAPNIRRPQARP